MISNNDILNFSGPAFIWNFLQLINKSIQPESENIYLIIKVQIETCIIKLVHIKFFWVWTKRMMITAWCDNYTVEMIEMIYSNYTQDFLYNRCKYFTEFGQCNAKLHITWTGAWNLHIISLRFALFQRYYSFYQFRKWESLAVSFITWH